MRARLQAGLHLGVARRAPRATSVLAALCLMAACAAEPGPMHLPIPERLTRALSARITQLSAEAQLVPAGTDAPGESTALRASEDGRSFSGFVPAAPGDYTLEVVFRGALDGGPLEFLGRWPSAAFTVSAGASADATFTKPLDTVGRPVDGGDPDGDRLGNLDETLLGTSRTSTDSDGDGTADALDCFPTARDRSAPIASGGSLLDCDGDGFLRLDPPWGTPGQDCDDARAEVRPTADDDCADAVDSDCNPQTCPSSDDLPPTIRDVRPDATTTVGCYASISAEITDVSGVSMGTVSFEQDPYPMGQPRIALLTDRGGDRWATNPIAASGYGLMMGDRPITISATDGRGNTAVQRTTVRFAFDVPTLTALRPAQLGAIEQPVDVTVEGTFPHGIGSIALETRTRTMTGTYEKATARVIGTAMTSPATFRVDPAMLGDGVHLVYPVLADAIGNRLEPADVTALVADMATGYIPCTGATPMIPSRVAAVGADSPFRTARLSDVLPRSLAAMRAISPTYVFTFATADRVRPDGSVRLDDNTDYGAFWLLGFRDPARGVFGSVRWTSVAQGTPSPVVRDDDGSISQDLPLDADRVADSDAVMAEFARAPGCPAIGGAVTAQINYQHFAPDDVVQVFASSGESWRGVAREPVVTTSDCR